MVIHLAGLQVNGRDAQLYEQAGLLTQRTVMAHGVTLTDAELQLLADRGTAIAHCPLSNFYFADVPLDVQRCLKAGVKVLCPSYITLQSSRLLLLMSLAAFAPAKGSLRSCRELERVL